MKMLASLKDLFKTIKRIFKTKKVVSQQLVSVNSLFPTPKRDIFNNDEAKLNELETLKKQYLKVLSSKKFFSSMDLNLENFSLDMLMNIDLLVQNCLGYNSLLKPNQEIDKELDVIIDAKKLQLYYDEILRMYFKTLIRLVALDEILNEKHFLLPNKKNAIVNEIVHLKYCIIEFINQREAIKQYIMGFMKNNEFQWKIDDYSQHFEERYKELRLMIWAVMPSEINQDDEANRITQIADMERQLEKYVYTHKEKIKKLNLEVDSLLHTEITGENKPYIEMQLECLEFKYKVFDWFGKEIVTEEDLKRFYQFKFNLLIFDIRFEVKSPFNRKMNAFEQKCYHDIIMKKIERIVTNQNLEVQRLFGNDTLVAIKYIIKILKDGYKNFDYDKILNDIRLIKFLLAFDEEYGLRDFYNNTWVSKTDYPYLDFFQVALGYDLDPILSLTTIYWLLSHKNKEEPSYLFDLYRLMEKNNTDNEGIYALPEGLKKLKRLLGSYDIQLTEEIRKRARDKWVVLPSSLKEILYFFCEVHLLGVVLNEGLEKIGDKAFYGCEITELEIPASVEYIDRNAFKGQELETITFRDYKNSKLLNNENNMKEFMRSLYFVRKCLKKENSSFFQSGVLDTNIMQMIFLDEDGRVAFTLYHDDLKFSFPLDPLSEDFNLRQLALCYSGDFKLTGFAENFIIDKLKEKILAKEGEARIRKNNFM